MRQPVSILWVIPYLCCPPCLLTQRVAGSRPCSAVGADECKPAEGKEEWLGTLAADPSRCVADGTTLHVGYHCFGYFWCVVVGAHAARSWYAVQPALSAAYFAGAADLFGGGGEGGAGGVPPLAAGGRTINVGIHHRSVKRRRFSNIVYQSVMDALRAKHAAWSAARLAAGAPRPPRLHFHLHSDASWPLDPVNAEQEASRLAKPGLLLETACAAPAAGRRSLTKGCIRRADLTVYTASEVADPLAVMHHPATSLGDTWHAPLAACPPNPNLLIMTRGR